MREKTFSIQIGRCALHSKYIDGWKEGHWFGVYCHKLLWKLVYPIRDWN